MMYLGTEEAKMLSCNLKDLFANPIARGIASIEVEKMEDDEFQRLL